MPGSSFQRGFSIIELMVAMVVGLLIVAATSSLFISTKRAYVDSELVSRMQENGRFALNVLADELRLVNFWGEAPQPEIRQRSDLDPITGDCTGQAAGYLLDSPIFAVTAASSTVASCVNDAQVNSDVLFVKHVAPTPISLADIRNDRSYVMANPFFGILFDGADPPPSNAVGGDVPNGQLWEIRSALYYVRNDGVTPPALVRRLLRSGAWSPPEEIAAGVENIQFLFGVDDNSDNTVDRYVSTADANFDQVIAARVFLLVRSDTQDGSYLDRRTYQLGSLTINNPGDHFRRMVYETTISLRNRRPFVLGG